MNVDIVPMAMNLARRLGPPPPEIMAALGVLAPPRARGRDEDERDADSDGSVDTLGEPRDRGGNRDRDRYDEGARTGAERYPWRSAGFSSRPVGTATAQDTLDLEIDAQQTWTALERMRKWKDRLHRENKTLRADVERLKSEVKEGRKREAEGKKEVERLKARYEEVWNDKVMLAEKISGPASMPLEILLNIAGFVAGANHYGTLLNFSLVSKLIREEVKPVLYETMWFTDSRGVPADMGSKRHPEYKFVKFVFVDDYTSPSRVKKAFSNLRASFHLMPGSMANTDTAEDKEDYSPYIAQMSIFRPVRMYTLTSLLAHPVKWIQGRHTKTHAIQGLSAVDIDAHGALLPSIKDEEDVAFRNVVKACSFKTTDVQTDALDESIKQLVKFMPVIPSNHERRPRGVWDPYPAITIYTSNREELDAWLANLAAMLLRQPNMYVEFSAIGSLTRDEFQDRLLRAAAAYGTVWHQIKDSLKTLNARAEFFVMDFESGASGDMWRGRYDDPNMFTLAGELRCARTGDGFGAKIVEIDNETGQERTVYDRPVDVPAA